MYQKTHYIFGRMIEKHVLSLNVSLHDRLSNASQLTFNSCTGPLRFLNDASHKMLVILSASVFRIKYIYILDTLIQVIFL